MITDVHVYAETVKVEQKLSKLAITAAYSRVA